MGKPLPKIPGNHKSTLRLFKASNVATVIHDIHASKCRLISHINGDQNFQTLRHAHTDNTDIQNFTFCD